jgi:hypothetical protein
VTNQQLGIRSIVAQSRTGQLNKILKARDLNREIQRISSHPEDVAAICYTPIAADHSESENLPPENRCGNPKE